MPDSLLFLQEREDAMKGSVFRCGERIFFVFGLFSFERPRRDGIFMPECGYSSFPLCKGMQACHVLESFMVSPALRYYFIGLRDLPPERSLCIKAIYFS